MKHVVVVTRWRERYAEYERYIDHRSCQVSYIATEVGLGSVPVDAASTWIVPATDDLAAVRDGVSALAARYGEPSHVVALKEDDLLVGAALREDADCPGPRTPDLLPFRDKYLMSRAIEAAGLAVEPFAPVTDAGSVRDFGAAHGWPVIVKPRMKSASEGVVRVPGPMHIPELQPGLLVQAYNPNSIYHVDGIYDGGLRCWRAARYLNSCLGFLHGDFLGSVDEGDQDLNEAIGKATEQFLAQLATGPTVFHLEMFVDADRRECVFLEVGARVAGGESAFLWREVHGYDLMEQACRIQLGLRPTPAPATRTGHVAGYLLIPTPVPAPCRIRHATPMRGHTFSAKAELYAEVVPPPDYLVPAADSRYEHVAGRFRFRGPSTAAVEEAILATAARFRVVAEPVVEAGSTALREAT